MSNCTSNYDAGVHIEDDGKNLTDHTLTSSHCTGSSGCSVEGNWSVFLCVCVLGSTTPRWTTTALDWPPARRTGPSRSLT